MIAIIICIAGVILYLATDNKPSRVGEIMFWVGLAFSLYLYGGMRVL